MSEQDRMAGLPGIEDFRDRVFLKASPFFRNPSWDLVDAFEADSMVLIRRVEELPEKIAELSRPEQVEYRRDTKSNRDSIRRVFNIRYDSPGHDTHEKTIYAANRHSSFFACCGLFSLMDVHPRSRSNIGAEDQRSRQREPLPNYPPRFPA